MIQVHHRGHRYHYELERLMRMFLAAPVTEVDNFPTEAPCIVTTIDRSGESPLLSVAVNLDGNLIERSESLAADANEELALARLLYDVLTGLTGSPLRWGLLTGVRPVKFVRTLTDGGMSRSEAKDYLTGKYLVSDEAINLAMETFDLQEQDIVRPAPDEFGLYISIPFCPSRCSYCSFVSHAIDKAAKLIPDYINCLCEEIRETGEIAAKAGLKLTSVYMGGGTPTVLEAGQLSRIMDAVNESFNMRFLREYTVEAGRPDTITRDKLAAIKNGGAGRISINPQTLDDRVLREIGRDHTADQFYAAFALAREIGFDCINTDLIAGLPGDTEAGFTDTVDRIIALKPENITIHTLSIKRAADMGGEPLSVVSAKAATVGAMLGSARHRLAAAGQRPYYLYRQQNTLGGYENVGYALPGHEGLYNVVMMEEIGSVIAVGAGAVTRMIDGAGHIERIFALKYPYEYIARPAKRADRKVRIETYYEDRLSR